MRRLLLGALTATAAVAGAYFLDGWASAAVVLCALAVLAGVVRLGAVRRGTSAPVPETAAEEASVDDLTGLPDRRALHGAVIAALEPPARGAEEEDDEEDVALVALLVIDLDGFKELNDRYGHDVGDRLLLATAAQLSTCVPPSALLARLGGDEFAVLLGGDDALQARLVADRVSAAITALPPLDGACWRPSASIGVAFADPPLPDGEEEFFFGDEPEPEVLDGGVLEGDDPLAGAGELLRRAEVAMYSAKTTGGGVGLFDPAHDLAAKERAQLGDELRAALTGEGEPDRGASAQLVVHYQPQVEADGRMGGVEALVRWRHPRHGLVTPDVFLAVAEEQHLLGELTTHVMRTALLDTRDWHAAGHLVRVSVNVSPSCLVSPGFLPLVDEVLHDSGVEPGMLVVEVTEQVLMSDPHQALATARRLRERGVELSIDDYGTGYSSLSYLSDLPATELKLDRSFTRRVLDDTSTAAIVASTVDLAHRLGLRLVVEGVEDQATLDAVRALGCDETQGYLHGRAEPAASVLRWLEHGLGSELRGAQASSGQASSAEVSSTV